MLSRLRLRVPLPMHYFSDSTQACDSKERRPLAWNTSPPCTKSSPCHEIYAIVKLPFLTSSRSMHSSRRPRMCVRTMSICCVISRSTATPLRASSTGWQGGPISLPLIRPSRACSADCDLKYRYPCITFLTLRRHAIARKEAPSHGKQARRARKPVLVMKYAILSNYLARRGAGQLRCEA